MIKHNISAVKNCFGCGVCASACAKRIISIELNKNGFYEPLINVETECTHCGICVDVCAFSNKGLATPSSPKQSWAAWSNDSVVRKICSSGGIAFEIGRTLVERGYKVVCCKYDVESQKAVHYIANTVDDLVESIGSKYIQSYTVDAFQQILLKGEKYLVIGTPCQIDSFRRFIKRFKCEENFILMDFFCHSIPSMFVWKSYVKMLESKLGKITYASWRNKFEYGWHDSWLMGIDGEKSNPDKRILLRERDTKIKSRMSKGDLFYRLFLGDLALGQQCEKHCKYKYDNSSADIRIGDLWGSTYKDNKDGVSALISFSDKGTQLVKSLKTVNLIEHSFDIAAEGQMKKNARPKVMKPVIMFLLRNDINISNPIFRLFLFAQKVISKLKSIL